MAIAPFFIDVNGYDSYALDWGPRAEHIADKILPANFDMQIGSALTFTENQTTIRATISAWKAVWACIFQ